MAGSDPLNEILGRLADVRPSGNGFAARCPAHDDNNPSLHVARAEDGRVLLKCFAGCTCSRICEALGIELSDLFVDGSGSETSSPFTGRAMFSSIEEATRDATQIWTYTDASGLPLLTIARLDIPSGKTFRPFHRVPGGVACGDPPGLLPLYNLPEVPHADWVFVVEGEKCADALQSIGIVATCSAHGANAAHKTDWSPLAGKTVIIIPDNDAPGRKYADDVARLLTGLDVPATVRVVELLGLDEGEDIFDWIEQRDSRESEDLKALILARADAAAPWSRPADGTPNDAAADSSNKKSQATKIVQLAKAKGIELWHNSEGEPYASIPIEEHKEHYDLHDSRLRRWLRRLLYDETGTAPRADALNDAVEVLGGDACFGGDEFLVHVRVAWVDRTMYLDLGDTGWHVVKVDEHGWELATNPPVRFRRPRGQLPIPVPVRGGCIDQLRPFINFGDERQWRLIIAWLLSCFMPNGPYPILEVSGEQGSAKTTGCRVLRRLVDPNQADLRSAPRNEHELVIAARNGLVLAFDNLSGCPHWLSDALCRLATGSAFGVRKLYSDSEECLFHGARPVIVNGIGDVASRPDLLDRTIRVSLPTIDDGQRQVESEFWVRFQQAASRILGALLDAVVTGIRRLPDITLSSHPRLADFAKWIVACESALGWPTGAFLEAYAGNRAQADRDAIEASPIGPALLAFLESRPAGFEGTASELLDELNHERGSSSVGLGPVSDNSRPPKGWPQRANEFGTLLKRIAPNLRAMGYTVELDNRTASRRTYLIKPPEPPMPKEGAEMSSSLSLSSQGQESPLDGADNDDGEDAHDDARWPAPPMRSALGLPETSP